jgi:uncharacterized linocin/CFP29 family protein
MNHLKRSLAPILPEAWKLIDDEARRVLRVNLAGRKLADFKGPLGWKFAAVNTGRVEPVAESLASEVNVSIRRVQPLVELRVAIRLDLAELDCVARGADDPELGPVVEAAKRIARAEDAAIFNGYERGGITGIIQASPHAPLAFAKAAELPRCVAEARETLRAAGVDGPYALALGTTLYEEVTAASEDGYPVLKHLERLMDGPIAHAPAITGGVMLSVRGGDYELTVGQDFSIGYAHHEKQSVELYLGESFTFRVLEPAAAVALRGQAG